jgi:hypothetical protein
MDGFRRYPRKYETVAEKMAKLEKSLKKEVFWPATLKQLARIPRQPLRGSVVLTISAGLRLEKLT